MKPVELYWGNLVLWLGPWKAGEIVPRWLGLVAGPPQLWVGEVAATWRDEHGEAMAGEAMTRVEEIVAGQLASLGIKAAVFTRPGGVQRKVHLP